MRSAPAVRVVVQRQGVWRASVFGWTLLSGSVGAWWLIGLHGTVHPAVIAVLATAMSACLAAAMTAAMGGAWVLRWDGQVWWLGDVSGNDVREGRLCVVVDLGDWMLLRFDATVDAESPAMTRSGPRRRWLPVQRRGLELQWHALRCAVHAPPPSPLRPAR